MKDKPTVSGDYLVKKKRNNRVKVVEHGGWPSWVDELVIVERVPPSGLHAFTLATSSGNKKFIAVATKR
ncbi:hypothetical protein Peur_039618 [Populus x canadensis]